MFSTFSRIKQFVVSEFTEKKSDICIQQLKNDCGKKWPSNVLTIFSLCRFTNYELKYKSAF